MIEVGIPDRAPLFSRGCAPLRRSHRYRQRHLLHLFLKPRGHAQLSSTVVYADAVGQGEQDIAARTWD